MVIEVFTFGGMGSRPPVPLLHLGKHVEDALFLLGAHAVVGHELGMHIGALAPGVSYRDLAKSGFELGAG